MMDIQAAIGLHQLARVETQRARRESVWNRYVDAFDSLPVRLPAPPEPDTRHALHLFTLLLDPDRAPVSRDAFVNAQTAENIGVGIHYVSIPEHPFYRQTFGWIPDDYPHALAIGRNTVSIPLSSRLTDRDVADVIAAVRKTLD
jgi:dTDP-4-amino-4,6-dideoxygalactose transaminase